MRKFWFLIATTMLVVQASFLAAALNAHENAAPAFSLMNIHNHKRTLSEFKGKIVFINFWASWCAPCEVELPELNRMATEYQGRKVQVIAINVDRDRRLALGLLAKLGLTNSHLEILFDPASKVVSTYQIEAMPSSFLLDAHGRIAFTHEGYHSSDPDLWRQEIDRLLGRRG
jgi:thiol-disulfide isomerase/thioredoxin